MLRTKGAKKQPYLCVPGSREFTADSDGLYGRFVCDEDRYLEYVDVLAIEVCQKRQNFYDKRSRYVEQNPLGLYCQPEWLKRATFLKHLADHELQNIPVRYRAVLYVLPPEEFQLVKKHLSPWGNEYFVDDENFPLAHTVFGKVAQPESRFIQPRDIE